MTTLRRKSKRSFLHSHLHPGSFGQLAVQQLDYSPLHDSFKFLWRAGNGRGRGRPCHTACGFVHGLVGQFIGFAIMFAEGVIDGKPVHLGNQLFRAAVKFLQSRVLDFIDAFDLANQQFRVAHYFKRFVSVLDGVLECRDQARYSAKLLV